MRRVLTGEEGRWLGKTSEVERGSMYDKCAYSPRVSIEPVQSEAKCGDV